MRPNRGSALTLLSSLSHYIYSATAASPLVDLGYTGVQGVRNDSTGVDSFLGIPYAVAPVGDLRWRAPVPIELGNSASFGRALNATMQGPQCVQGQPVWISALSAVYGDTASFAAPLSSSEDCLILDVFAPSNATSQDLPVLLWIHGGGYAVGNAANAGGPNFVSSSNGSVIFVSIQYRLGAYGFLASDAVAEDGTPNAALLDQRAALDWVQRHISAFGGDPSKVTIWGGSAGGGSVTAQLILNGGEEHPPFRAAIPEYPWWQSYKNQSTLNSQYTDLLAASNCSDLTCLRSLPYENLVNASLSTYQTGYEDGKYAYGDFYYGPAVDGVTIRDYPQREIEAGHFSKVALLTDHSAFEGVAFTNFSTSTWNETVDNLKVLWPEAGATFFDRVQQLYPLSDFSGAYFDNPFFSSQTVDGIESRLNFSIKTNSEYWRAQQIYSDYIINCPTYYQAVAFSEHDLPVYKLVFNAGNEIHGAPQSFFQLAPSETPTPDLARAMLGYWTSFTATLDPNAISYPNASGAVWPQYAGGDQTDFSVLEVYPTSFQVRSDSDANAKCDFLYGRSRVVYN